MREEIVRAGVRVCEQVHKCASETQVCVSEMNKCAGVRASMKIVGEVV